MPTPQEVIQQTIDGVYAACDGLTFDQKREVMTGLSIAAQQQLTILNQADLAAQASFAAANLQAFTVMRDTVLAQKLAESEGPPPRDEDRPADPGPAPKIIPVI